MGMLRDRVDALWTATFEQLPSSVRDVLGRLAIDDATVFDDPALREAVRDLIRRGLIVPVGSAEVTLRSPGQLPVKVRVPKYAMPHAVHIAWCDWCSREFNDDVND